MQQSAKLNTAKLNSAQIIGNAHEIKKKMEACQIEVKDYEDKVKLALSKNNEELAKKALARKIESEKKLGQREDRLDSRPRSGDI